MIKRTRLALLQYAFLASFVIFVLGSATSTALLIWIGAFGTFGLAFVLISLFIGEYILRFFALQKNIGEVAATIFFIALGCTLVVAIYPSGMLRYAGLAGCHVWGFAGAVWAWHRARVNQVQAPQRRLAYLLIGWAGTLGLGALIALVMALIIALDAKNKGRQLLPEDGEDLLAAIKYSAIFIPLSIPLFYIEYRIRERARKGL